MDNCNCEPGLEEQEEWWEELVKTKKLKRRLVKKVIAGDCEDLSIEEILELARVLEKIPMSLSAKILSRALRYALEGQWRLSHEKEGIP